MSTSVQRPEVKGVNLDPETRCAHWHSVWDIVAIQMKCCTVFYACTDCHDALADHPLEVWPQTEWDEKAVLCGHCGTELSIRQYMECQSTCPACHAQFNPGCSRHFHCYFRMP